jgi:hypothetical protein
MDNRKEWPCPSCQTNLGFVVGGEIAIDLNSVANITTQGVNTVFVCKKCGRQKSWFAKNMAISDAFIKNLGENIAEHLANMLGDNSGNH